MKFQFKCDLSKFTPLYINTMGYVIEITSNRAPTDLDDGTTNSSYPKLSIRKFHADDLIPIDCRWSLYSNTGATITSGITDVFGSSPFPRVDCGQYELSITPVV